MLNIGNHEWEIVIRASIELTEWRFSTPNKPPEWRWTSKESSEYDWDEACSACWFDREEWIRGHPEWTWTMQPTLPWCIDHWYARPWKLPVSDDRFHRWYCLEEEQEDQVRRETARVSMITDQHWVVRRWCRRSHRQWRENTRRVNRRELYPTEREDDERKGRDWSHVMFEGLRIHEGFFSFKFGHWTTLNGSRNKLSIVSLQSDDHDLKVKSRLFIPTDMFPLLFSYHPSTHTRTHTNRCWWLGSLEPTVSQSIALHHHPATSRSIRMNRDQTERVIQRISRMSVHTKESCSPSQNKPEGRWTHSPLLCLPLKEQKMSWRRSQERPVSAHARWRWSVSMKNPTTNHFPVEDSFLTIGRLLFDEGWYEHPSFDTYVPAWSQVNQTPEEVFLCLQTLQIAFHQTLGGAKELQLVSDNLGNEQQLSAELHRHC